MIVDTSAVVAVLWSEPTAAQVDAALRRSTHNRMSAASYVELGVVVDRRSDPAQRRRIDMTLDLYRIVLEPVTAEQARLARAAYTDFGRGSGHPARLNYGDTFSYALAATTREPLLFVGDDFTHTDVTPALPR